MRSVAQDRQRPASGSEESDTAARSKRRRRRMPTQYQNRSRQKKNHQKHIHAGIIAQPAEQQRPRQVQPPRAAYAGRPVTARSSHAPGRPISPCAVVVQTTGSARTLPGASRLVPRTLGAVLPVLCAAKRRVRRGAHKPACKCRNPLPFYQRYAAQKKSEAPYTCQRPPPRCREMRGIAVHAATFDRPSQPHPSTPTEQRKADCSLVQRRGPPTSRARIAGGANPASPSRIDRDARPTCVRRTDAARGRGRKPGEPGKGCSITGRAANSRRPPQAVHTLFAVPHQVAASAKRPPRTSCRRNQGEKRMNPVMKVPCQNRPHLLPTGRWSGGRTGRRAMR